MDHLISEEGNYRYIETNPGKETIMLLHGLFGALSNFKGIFDRFGENYNVVIPILPILELSLRKVSLKNMVEHIEGFIAFKGFDSVHIVGNSLGGHIAQLYILKNPEKVISLTLTGSSGLFENAMGSTFPKRGNYDFIKTKTESTFYDPVIATKEMVDEVFETVNDRSKAIKVVAMAKSAIRNNLEGLIGAINSPTLLVWGNQDIITPPFVGEKFHELIPNSKLVKIDKCGHAPMMEQPEEFNDILESFLNDIKKGVK